MFYIWFHYRGRLERRHRNSVHHGGHSRLSLEDAFEIDASRLAAFDSWENELHSAGYWTAPEVVPPTLAVDATKPAKEQLNALDAWLKRYKRRTAGDWPDAAAGLPEVK